jgi:predicted alpha/beta superfamily hydrolase
MIRVPDDYDQDSAPLPVIYALDGQIRNAYYPRIIKESDSRVILVQIHDMGARSIDDIMPGALAFQAFITMDLFSFIEANYRIDPTRRAISGLSLAAEFPLLSLYLDSPGGWHFSHYHVVDWGAWLEEAISTEQKIYDVMANRSLPVTLIFARGTSQFSPTTKVIYDLFAGRKYRDLNLYYWAYPTGHVETDTPALVDLLDLLCGPTKCRGLEH